MFQLRWPLSFTAISMTRSSSKSQTERFHYVLLCLYTGSPNSKPLTGLCLHFKQRRGHHWSHYCQRDLHQTSVESQRDRQSLCLHLQKRRHLQVLPLTLHSLLCFPETQVRNCKISLLQLFHLIVDFDQCLA